MNTYLILAIAALAILAILYAGIRMGYKKQIAQILFYLVVQAEKQFGGGTGEFKFTAVSAWLYERMPIVARWFFTQKQIDILIEEAVQRMKEYLSSNAKAQVLIT